MLVKVNTVLIPGINDQSIAQLSEALKQRGAFLHNIMPLISEPEHGTYYAESDALAHRAGNRRGSQSIRVVSSANDSLPTMSSGCRGPVGCSLFF
ncbi:nitrogenase FeMo-cofactor synthesis FeS core scaffold and assembly protein NifB [Vibrio astriarenae]|nr:nitrogenase FeMo-cofactor synthesis FeS core scaffold and assembly protein NifB [Vibrio sp. C7]